MSLADKLDPEDHPDARRTRSHEDGVRFVAGEPAEVSINLKTIPENEEQWRAEIKRVTGLTIPDHRQVELHSTRWWGPPGDPFIYVRFDIRDRDTASPSTVDAVALLRELRAGRPEPDVRAGEANSAFVLSWGDWQVGKLEGGGTPALAERLDRAFDNAVNRLMELAVLGRGPSELVILGGGDLVEGCDLFPNHAFEIDSDRRAQVNNTVTLILEGLDRLAPFFHRVRVLAVGGNHGENRIGHKRTNRRDNDDCAVFEHAARATQRDPKLQHVEYFIAQGEPAKTLEVCGWILGTTHGQAYGKGGSGSIDQKVLRWFQGQAAGRFPIGDSDVLVTHHFHHLAARDWGGCQWLQAPAMDGGSAWLADLNGMYSQPGMLSFVMTPENRFQDLQIL